MKTLNTISKKLLILVAFITIGLSSVGQNQVNMEYKEALKEMVLASPFGDMTMTDINRLLDYNRRFHGSISDEKWDEFKAEYSPLYFDKNMEVFTPAYEKYLSLQDIKEMTAFYKVDNSKDVGAIPAGQKYKESYFELYDECREANTKLVATLEKDIEEYLVKNGYK